MKTTDRLMHIEMAAARLGLTCMTDSKVADSYTMPSTEEDMQDFNLHVFGCPVHNVTEEA